MLDVDFFIPQEEIHPYARRPFNHLFLVFGRDHVSLTLYYIQIKRDFISKVPRIWNFYLTDLNLL